MNDHDSQNALVQAFERLDFSDTNTIMQLGHHAQVNISMLSESVLSVTKSMRTQEIYSTLEQTIDDLLVFREKGNPGKWRFSFGRRRAKEYSFLNWCRNAEHRMDMVSDRLREHQVYLLKNIVMLEEFSRMNRSNEKELEEAVQIGTKAAEKLREKNRLELEESSRTTVRSVEMRIKERDNQISRIEKRVQELLLSRQVSRQLDEQLLILKHNEQLMADKIQGILWNTLVLWKNQIALMMEQGHIESRDYATIDLRNRELIDHLSEMVRLKKEDDEMLDQMKQTSMQ